jgi:replicative DNA helicase
MEAEVMAPPAMRRRLRGTERSADLLLVVEDYVRLLRTINRPTQEIDLAEKRLRALRSLHENLAN